MSRHLPAFVRFSSLACLLSLVCFVGCGKSGGESDVAATRAPAAAPAAPMSGAQDFQAAVNAVSQFLDAIRRGGDSDRAHSLLTSQSVKVLEGLGRTIEPIGSPDATFQVTRGEPVEDHPGMALVHSTWTEPTAEGNTESYQVVWALQFEQGWKISGLAMELDPAEPPMIVDFEDAALMAELFRNVVVEDEAAENVRTAGAASETGAF